MRCSVCHKLLGERVVVRDVFRYCPECSSVPELQPDPNRKYTVAEDPHRWMVTEHRKPEHPAETPLEVTDSRTVAIVYGGAEVVRGGWPYWREVGPLPSV